MEETEDKKMREEEINFLKEELKRINDGITSYQYGGTKEATEAQVKLWELREIIKGKLYDELMKSHQTRENKNKKENGSVFHGGMK